MEHKSYESSDTTDFRSHKAHDSLEMQLDNPPGTEVNNVGKLSLTDSQAVYMGTSHWVTISEEVSIPPKNCADSDLTLSDTASER